MKKPQILEDAKITVTLSGRHMRPREATGEVVGFIPKSSRHVFEEALPEGMDQGAVHLLDLSSTSHLDFTISPLKAGVTLNPETVLAATGTHIKECAVCYDTLETGQPPLSQLPCPQLSLSQVNSPSFASRRTASRGMESRSATLDIQTRFVCRV